MIERFTDLSLADGPADSFVVHPEGNGPFPVVLFYMDAPGLREELFEMARRIARSGYFVVLPNLFYRAGLGLRLSSACNEPGSEEFGRMFDLLGSLSVPMVMADTARILDWLSSETLADASRIGAIGYCMSGRFAIAAAATWPDRVKAAASFFGTSIVTEADDSPHRMAQAAQGELYFGFGELDAYAPPSDIPDLKASLDAAPSTVRYEIYPGADHGFAFPDRATYHPEHAEKHWVELLDLFDRNLARG